jgi:DNA-binding transcriptional ArsR family regulator
MCCRWVAHGFWASTFPGEEPREGNSTLVELSLIPEGDKTRLRLVESGFAALSAPEETRRKSFEDNVGGRAEELDRAPAASGAFCGVTTEPGTVDAVLAVLADPTRRRLLDVLAARGAATATVLAAELPVSRQAVVKHLAVLHATGLVSGGGAGREARYTVSSQRLDATARWMVGLAADWDRRLEAIKRIAESGQGAE